MDYNFDTWKQALEDFRNAVSKDLEEIRKHKEEVQQAKSEIFSALNTGYFLRDDHRIVISAPEIIIGNVDTEGILRTDESSCVILRAQNISLEGVGDAGSVHTHAASIRQEAVNPGADGLTSVVGPLSEVVTQARSVVVEADKATGAFPKSPAAAGDGGVRIHADGQLAIDSSVSRVLQKKNLDDRIQHLEIMKSALEKEADDYIKGYDALADSIKDINESKEKVLKDEVSLSLNNITSYRYYDLSTVPQPGFWCMAGIKVKM